VNGGRGRRGWLVAAVWEGRDRTPGASWLHRPARDDTDSWIDERMISQALAHLGIAPLDRFFKAGGELVYTVPARVDGDGTYAQIRLPMGVTADMVAAKRTTLAANVGRPAWQPGPPRVRKPAPWICGWPIRANSAPAPGLCCTRAPWTCSRGCP
jgi:S-DNA-T family DNA segregation ATPase FtsK/SpoIIIE